MIEYGIVIESLPSVLAQEMNEAIAVGWKPIGGVGIDTEGYLYQAVIREKEKNALSGT